MTSPSHLLSTVAFIGGGNLAQAIIAGLLRSGLPAASVMVVEPSERQRKSLGSDFGINAQSEADSCLSSAQAVIWAVKPQNFRAAACACAPHVGAALQLSVMAGVRSDTLASLLSTQRVVRAMPNTPALIGQGISGVFARPAVTAQERAQAESLLAATGQTLWLDHEDQLDAVTAISGSGPAYVFYVIESLVEAAQSMGLSAQQGLQLALATFHGATALALHTQEPPAQLRERVTSKGGTTHAALQQLETAHVRQAFVRAAGAARDRACEMGREFGGPAAL